MAASGVSHPGPVTRFQVFGPLRAWRGDVEVPVGGARRKAVLGLLLLEPGSVVSRGAIAEVLWDGSPPATAAAMIQSHISRLRGVLCPDAPSRGGLIATVAGGYRFRAEGAEIDLVQGHEQVARARAAVQAGDVAGGCQLFGQALALWRWPPMADVDVLRGHPAVLGLAQELARVVVEYAEVASARGLHDRVLPHLQALTGRDPLSERAHACLMIALAGSGRQAAALTVFEQLRRRLDEQLGVRPGPVLNDAHARVLRNDVPPMARGAGGTRASAAPVNPASGEPKPSQLPPALADFTGRLPEITKLQGWLGLDGDRGGLPILVISGPPGVGKTALMLQVGHLVRRSFPDGQLWAQLNGWSERPRDPAEVLGEWLRALGVHGSAIPDTLDERAAMFRSRLADRRVLIVADDAASAAQVLPLLPGTSGCAVLVASRRRLAELAGARFLPLGPLTSSEATDLLGQVAGQSRVAGEPQAAADLLAACGLLPLAVRIAAAKLAARPAAPIAALAEMLATERHRLDVLRVGDLSVRASIASGYRALSDKGRRAFRLLGLLGACDVAEWVIAALLGEPDAGAVVEELTDRSLLTYLGVDVTGLARFCLHDLLRDYAAEVLAEEPEDERAAALKRAHDGWLQLASLASAHLPSEAFFPRRSGLAVQGAVPESVARRATSDPLGWFNAERLNLLAITENACELGHHRFAARLALSQAEFQHLLDRPQDAARIWECIASAAAGADEAAVAAHALLRLGAAKVECGHADSAMKLLDESIAALADCGDVANLAFALYWRGACAWDLCLHQAAQDYTSHGVALAMEIGDRHAEFTNLAAFGVALAAVGSHEAAMAAGERAAGIAVELGDVAYEIEALHKLLQICTMTGESDRAIELSRGQRALCRELGDIRGEALSLGLRGDAYYALGQYEDAVRAYEQALPVFRDHFIHRHHGLCLLKLGRAYQGIGDQGEARQYLEASLRIFRDLRLHVHQEQALQALRDCGP